MRVLLIFLFFCVAPMGASAGEADVVNATAKEMKPGVWSISATVRHDDEGWDHYADRWEVLDAARKVIATRILAHPHENEQPFTRSLGGVSIAAGTKTVTIRARDSVHGYGGKEFLLRLGK